MSLFILTNAFVIKTVNLVNIRFIVPKCCGNEKCEKRKNTFQSHLRGNEYANIIQTLYSEALELPLEFDFTEKTNCVALINK